jgi:ribonuclease G
MPGLNAAFVDVGYEKDAFIHYLDLGQISIPFLSLHCRRSAIQKSAINAKN